ncbi:DUF4192 family protein [Cryobacterium tepidiphilum]|jgi:hypothetical protein|nr:DUF4192 family protein [Cryobacterium tepidiphilum]
MQPTVIKARQAQDFLALVPQLAGFLPRNSVVLVAFRGNRTCGALRFNLPESGVPHSVYARVASTLVGTLCKIAGVNAVVPVVYTDQPFHLPGGMPAQRFARALVEAAERSGFLVRDVLCVASDGWGSYDDPECPAHGRPLSDIAGSAVAAPPVIGTIESRAELPPASGPLKEKVARLYRRYRRLAGDTPALGVATGDVIDAITAAEEMLGWTEQSPDPEALAAMLFLVQSPPTRDQVMLQIAFGEEIGGVARDVNRRYEAIREATGRSFDEIAMAEHEAAAREPGVRTEAADAGALLGRLLTGFSRERPDPDRVERGIRMLALLVAHAPRAARPAPLCMLAWLSWTLGRGSVAGIFIDRVLAIEPGYSMAITLGVMFDAGHLPEWAWAEPEAG